MQIAFRALLAKHVDPDTIDEQLYETERRNLRHFGYGVKGFVLEHPTLVRMFVLGKLLENPPARATLSAHARIHLR